MSSAPVLCRRCWHDETEHRSEQSWVCTGRDVNDEPCLCNGFDPRDEPDDEEDE
jgi:hypothetical protein